LHNGCPPGFDGRIAMDWALVAAFGPLLRHLGPDSPDVSESGSGVAPLQENTKWQIWQDLFTDNPSGMAGWKKSELTGEFLRSTLPALDLATNYVSPRRFWGFSFRKPLHGIAC
jgi:hypothetical protein